MSAQTPARVYTGQLSGQAQTIVMADNVTEMTVTVISGTVTIKGNAGFLNSNAGSGFLASVAVPLPVGTPFTYTTPGAQAPFDGFTIDATAGEAIVVYKM